MNNDEEIDIVLESVLNKVDGFIGYKIMMCDREKNR